MRINDSIAFFHWVKSQGLVNLSPEVAAYVRCVEEQQRMCNCDPEPTRKAKNEQCRSLYNNLLSKIPQFRDQLLAKSSDSSLVLCVDGQPVITITR